MADKAVNYHDTTSGSIIYHNYAQGGTPLERKLEELRQEVEALDRRAKRTDERTRELKKRAEAIERRLRESMSDD